MINAAITAVAEIVCAHHYLIFPRAGDADEIAIKGFGAVEIKGSLRMEATAACFSSLCLSVRALDRRV